MSSESWPWLALVALGAYHGLNPAMGWLFAVALGLQEGRRSAVLRALPPIALGHEAAVGLAVALVAGLRVVADPTALRLIAAAALMLFGMYKLLRPRSHPRWVGMRVNTRDLFVWSFLMSSAHGAGLMLVPMLFGLPADGDVHPLPAVQDAAAVLLHTLAMLAAMGAVALVVYEKLGVTFLRRAWANLDPVWAGAIATAGVATLFT